MEYFVGIDLGTSSVRAVAVDPDGNAAAAGQCEYDIQKPELDRAEQDMDQLWEATVQMRSGGSVFPGRCTAL